MTRILGCLAELDLMGAGAGVGVVLDAYAEGKLVMAMQTAMERGFLITFVSWGTSLLDALFL